MPRPKPAPDAAWEDLNQRVTFYCPRDLVEAIAVAMADGQSKTQVIVNALRAQLLNRAPDPVLRPSAPKHQRGDTTMGS